MSGTGWPGCATPGDMWKALPKSCEMSVQFSPRGAVEKHLNVWLKMPKAVVHRELAALQPISNMQKKQLGTLSAHQF